ncbi:tripartite tricarboxylate transporter substrate binding protein [Caenimonas aquaedulcis]|uniref:Tripartite tricarboxylate transporter substrate binding protein n=1 Tax=Caenimonas aquaedulcis TaxID=2793270 RepID=A0A931H957_9BURK|nr:tripartite tricarboxylate transporter substrate binding protein [Caenimonas aquaedulcis]MBG9390682.1 tripartite tricarboxylate transporter substrate binding protein [Caenimonas aquaedulcis]
MVALAATSFLAPGQARAQGAGDYPNRPINMVIPFAAGGGTDVVGRFIATALSEVLNQPVVVLNRPGAAGVLGTQVTKAAPADGYTLMFTSQSIVTQSYEPEAKASHRDFILIGMLNQDAFGLAVEKSAKWRTLKEFIDDAKKQPGALSVGTTGFGSATYMQIPLLEKAAGIKLNPIPYNGSAGFQTAVLGKTVDAAGVVMGDAAALLKGGQLRMLGIMSANRLEMFPDVPTYRELGVNVDFIFWRGLFVHKDTPAPIVAALRTAVGKVARSPAFKDKMVNASYIPAAIVDDAETHAFIRKEEGIVEEVLKSLKPAAK